MKRAERIESWNKNLYIHRERFDRCIEFLRENKKTVEKFHHRALSKLLSADKAAKHRLYFLFIDCLGAAGARNLTGTAKASNKFLKTLEKFGLNETISFKKFASEIGAKPEDTEGVFKILAGGSFSHFGAKKAALFMRQIAQCQSCAELRIFSDLKSRDVYQLIPLDVIIADLCSQILGLDEVRFKPGRDFKDFNKWARDTLKEKDDYMLFEHLWFWGYFATKVKDDGKKPRTIEVNDAKLETNPWFYPISDYAPRKKLDKFCQLFQQSSHAR